MKRVPKLAGVILLGSVFLLAQSNPPAPARVNVMIGHHFTEKAPTLTRENLKVTQGIEEVPIVSVTPLRGPLEIFFLVDQCSSCEPGSKFDELRRFILALPAGSKAGVAYIANSKLGIAIEPTTDRERAAQALNAPQGATAASPFPVLTELIRGWADDGSRRAVVMISNGLDPASDGNHTNAAAENAINEAIRAGVPIFALYHPSADYASADWEKLYNGQVQLAHVASESGGEAYFLGFGPLPSLAPFLNDVSDHLANQYAVEFTPLVAPPGGFADLTIRGTDSTLEIQAPAKVWLPAPATSVKPE